MQAVNTVEMARILGTSPDKVREMVHAGEIPHLPVGRLFKFIPERVIDALEQKHQVEPVMARSPRSRTARRKVY